MVGGAKEPGTMRIVGLGLDIVRCLIGDISSRWCKERLFSSVRYRANIRGMNGGR